jgi:putative PIG3 family NAD(P)H quinone oxidoreductase
MKAVGLNRFGGVDVLEILNIPQPRSKPGEVLIKVEASGINRADILIREGRYRGHTSFPVVPGFEMQNFKTGERVFALLEIGGYAEYVSVPENLVLPVPDKMSFGEAAGIPDVFLTAWLTLFKKAQLRKGEMVLIHAAGSGIGMAAIQLAKAFGATVMTTASTDEKLQRAQKLGADYTINYREKDFAEAVKELTAGRGVDVVLDGVGGSTLDGDVKAIASFGRIILIGTVGGREAQLHLGRAITKNVSLYAFRLHGHSESEMADYLQEFGREVMPLFADGKIHCVVDKTFKLEQAHEAHNYLEQRKNFGKVILLP